MPKTNNSGMMSVWVCWHPKLGYLAFNSYSTAVASPEPLPRAFYRTENGASERIRKASKPFWCDGKAYNYEDVEVREIQVHWTFDSKRSPACS